MAEYFSALNEKPMYVAGVEAVKDYTSQDKVKRTNPRVKLRVSPFIPPFIPVDFVSQDLGGLIQSCQYSKSRSQAYGKWTVTMAADDDEATKGATGWPLNSLWRALGASVLDIIKPMTLVQLWVDGYHVMTGFNRVGRRQSSPGSIEYYFEFDELGSLYEEDILKKEVTLYGEYTRVINNMKSALGPVSSLEGLTLGAAINLMANAFWTSTYSYGAKGFPTPYWRASDGVPLASRMVALPSPLGGVSNNSIISTLVTSSSMFDLAGGGTFWSYLKNLCPEPYMELFTESGGRTICTGRINPNPPTSSASLLTGGSVSVPGINVTPMLPGFNYLIARTSPYDNPILGSSPYISFLMPLLMGVFDLILAGDFVIATDYDVISKNLGKSDAQQYTGFQSNFTGKSAGNAAATAFNPPSVSSGPSAPIFPGGIDTYGYRLFTANINPTSVGSTAILGESIERLLRRSPAASPVNVLSMSTLLNVWFRNAANFNEGTITTRPIPYARPGMVFLYLPPVDGTEVENPRDIGVYYIDAISYNYEIGEAPTMTFSVIRGTPLPNVLSNIAQVLMFWEIIPPGLNVLDGEF